MSPTREPVPVARSVLCFLLGAAALGCLHTEGPLVRGDWLPLLAWLAAPLVLVILLSRVGGDGPRAAVATQTPLLILAGFTFLYLFSSASQHRWAFFVRWPRGEADPMRMDLGHLILWTSLLIPVFVTRIRRVWMLVLGVLVLSQVAALAGLMVGTGGRALYCDDHPSMMFRLWEFARTFPRLVNYNPYWNAGTVHFAGVSSGVHGPGLLLWPVWRLMPVHEVYTWGFGVLFIIVIPLIAAASVRALGGGRTASLIAACLALGVSHHAFLWQLYYGTIGAVASSMMILPVSALTYAALQEGRMGAGRAVALVLSLFWLVLWPMGAVLAATVALACLLHARAWTWRRIGFLVGCVAIALLLYLPWMRVVLGEGGSILDFVFRSEGAWTRTALGFHSHGGTGSGPAAGAGGLPFSREFLRAGWVYLLAHVREGNPLLIFFGLLGFVAVRRRPLARWYGAICVALAVLTGWSRFSLPHAQLWRMAIPLFAVSALPASLLLARVLECRDVRVAGIRAGLAALLALGGLNVARIYANHARLEYAVLDGHVREFADWLTEHVPADGRVLFAGPTVHAYFKGHVAYLPVLTGREMMASDYYAFPPESTDYRYPPPEYADTFEGLRGFLEAYNVTHVVTCHDAWRARLRDYDFYFTEVADFDYLTVFKAARESRPLLAGRGRVEGDFNRIRVDVDGALDEGVLCYNWVDGLRPRPPAECFPYETDNGLTLIGFRPNGATNVTIRYRP